MPLAEPSHRDLTPTLAAISALGGMMTLGPVSKTPYFLGAATFFGMALLGFLVAHAARRFGRPGLSLTALITGAVFFSYALMEIVFQRVDLHLPLTATGPAGAAFLDLMNTYVLDRSYQYVAILALWVLLWKGLPTGWASFLRVGDVSQETPILGGPQPMSWARVGTRIGGMILLLGGVNAFLKLSQPFDGKMLAILSGRLLGGFNNSLIEEMVFRGLLLPAFAMAVSPGKANFLQAAFFSVIHYTFLGEWALVPVAQEAAKLLLYLGIGWFLGRAAADTRGIGISTALHFFITGVIWATLTFSGS